MAQISISVEKSVSFRGAVQHFSNTYVYGSAGLTPDAALAEQLLDEVVAQEKTFHATTVAFKRGRVWTSGGTKAENNMIFQKVLTGTGALSPAGQDPERAVLVYWHAGFDIRNKKVFLRKWYHTCASTFNTVPIGTNAYSQEIPFTTAQRQLIAAKVDPLTRIGNLAFGLIAESGRQRDPQNAPPEAHKWLEHHQLGEQWRG